MDRKTLSAALLTLLVAQAGFASTPVPASVTTLAAQAAKGDAKAEVALGERYQSGTGVEQSFSKANDLYTQAAEQGNRQGEFDLGNLYNFGLGVPKDSAKAAGWFEKAGLQGSTEADETLAGMYHDGTGVPQDFAKALSWYRRAADLGDTLAQMDVAGYYIAGIGIKKDYVEAMHWYRRAAARGNAVAESSVGWMYLNGYGVKKDTVAAERWYLKSVEQDNPAAEITLGYAYLTGQLGKPDYAKALKWLTKAAGHDDADSEFLLGEMYRLGKGVTQDYATAVSWYQRASDLGQPQAETELSVAYYWGYGVPIDKSKSISLIRDAAGRGFAPAEMSLADLYFSGRDIPRDASQGQQWLDKAIAQKYPGAVCGAAFATLYGTAPDADRAQALATMRTQAEAGDSICVNNFAWYMATTAGVKPEDLDHSVEMMGKLLDANSENPSHLDTMAAVEAAEGHYDAAVSDEQKAIDAVSGSSDSEGFLKDANERLALYRSNKPYIAPPAASTTPALQASTTAPAVASTAVQTESVNGCYVQEPAKVALTGVLTTAMYEDPIKNSSVTSNKVERALLLSFRPSICSSGGLDGPQPDIRELELVYAGGTQKLYESIGQYKGQKVRCTGEIWGIELRIVDVTDCVPVSE